MPVRVTDSGSPSQAGVACGITRAVDAGADVIAVVLQFDGATTELVDAITYAVSHDVLVIASSGDNNAPIVSCPACLSGCLAVSGTTHQDLAAPFSNYGDAVDLSAPAQHIVSTWSDADYMTLSDSWQASVAE